MPSNNFGAALLGRFDLLFAVVYPIVVLAYCYANFDFDRDAFQLYTAVFAPGSFERQARMAANPSEIFLFRTSFDSLRILTTTDFLLRIGMNLSFCNRFKRVVEVQVARRRRHVVAAHPRQRSQSRVDQQLVPRYLAIPFALFGAIVLALTYLSVTASASACAAYPECVVYARRWNADELCPCLILIDTDKSPRTYGEWEHPVDKTETVKRLASSGDLRVIQLINRRLLELPSELQRCTAIKYMCVSSPNAPSVRQNRTADAY